MTCGCEARSQVSTLQGKIVQLEAKVSDLEAEVEDLERELEDAREEVAEEYEKDAARALHLVVRHVGLVYDSSEEETEYTLADGICEKVDGLTRKVKRLEAVLEYLLKLNMRVPAVVVDVDSDPAGGSTTYEPDKRAVELFGEENLMFEVGCGLSPSCYRVNWKKVKD